ncbi:unnamed protein product [Oppiella nova]|uniref:Matrin-type domain-containing protein n=1 Tax=Oppiella nova TaxID=334625 RepID=A0A7R9QER3_9ACAR|nr:unnamed protein product [Oppiella nova]CAG2164329.1 unnamed protein product [Oppiella nova]
METMLEQQRRYHEERERLEEAMVKENMTKKSSVSDLTIDETINRDQINSDHRLKILLDFLKMGKHPNEISVPMAVEFDEFFKIRDNPNEINLVDFTDEEGYGKFLDLNHCFEKYLNLKSVDRIDYLSYLSLFDQLFDVPKDRKLNADYVRYLETLLDYLQDYCSRVKPLLSLPTIMEKVLVDFEKQWESGSFPGWPKEAGSALTHAGAHLDLSAFTSVEELASLGLDRLKSALIALGLKQVTSVEELASLGLDRLKSALIALGLKCGGTLEERAHRLWHTKGKSADEIDPTFFAKTSKRGKAGKTKDTERQKETAILEAQVYKLSEILSEQRQATKENVQRKQARTAGERQESDEEVSESESEEETETDVIYNPKNLPLGWDGKPIPYWLYKLHGLNITYTCEICGNATYKGPKAFQRHFAEWRHAHGMRCLGIPNTAHFANVTQIEDALALWQRLKEEKHKEKFQPSNEEEYEDTQGNVVNKKTYEDLKRQGLL